MAKSIIIMGVSGCGKTTIGNELSQHMDIPFFDGDDYHPIENVDKMTSGKPLNDDDREGWLKAINSVLKKHESEKGCIFACSALKESYRDLLREGLEDELHWVLPVSDFSTIYSRMKNRAEHYMPPALLKSQFETLEIPSYAITVNANQSLQSILFDVFKKIK